MQKWKINIPGRSHYPPWRCDSLSGTVETAWAQWKALIVWHFRIREYWYSSYFCYKFGVFLLWFCVLLGWVFLLWQAETNEHKWNNITVIQMDNKTWHLASLALHEKATQITDITTKWYMQQKHAQFLILQGKRAANTVCSAGSVSLFACSSAALRYWWVERFYTLNAIPRETELTSHFHCINSSGWKKIPHPILLASRSQLADSGHRTVLGKKHNCLLCLSLLLSSHPVLHPPWHIWADQLTTISWQELTCFRFIRHWSSALQSFADRFGHST